MKHLLQNFFVIAFAIPLVSLSQIPGNDNCVNAIGLSPNAACVSGTTFNGTIQAGEPSLASQGLCYYQALTTPQTESVWYRFTANAADMYVEIQLTGFSGGGGSWYPQRWTSTVYNAGCMPTGANIINCQNSTTQAFNSGFGIVADGAIINRLTGLTVGNTYFIQVSYLDGGGIQNPNYCIRVGNATTCGLCDSPCGPGCPQAAQPATPTIAYANCPANVTPQNPIDEGGYQDTHCWTFTADVATVTYYGYVTLPTGCGPASFVTPPTPLWTLQTSNAGSGCGPVIQSGTSVNNITMSGLTIGQSYTFCLNAMVYPTCYLINYLAVFVGAQNLPAPVELVSFTATPSEIGVLVSWNTESELNNDYYLVQRSADGEHFEEIARLEGAGTSSDPLNYFFNDQHPVVGPNYYRLVQYDFDATAHYSNSVIVNIGSEISELLFYPNPVEGQGELSFVSGSECEANLRIIDAVGRTCYEERVQLAEGKNQIDFDLSEYQSGLYHIILTGWNGSRSVAFAK